MTQHAWSDFVTDRQRAGRGSGDRRMAMLLASLEARDDLVDRLHAEFDQELLEAAIVQMRLRGGSNARAQRERHAVH